MISRGFTAGSWRKRAAPSTAIVTMRISRRTVPPSQKTTESRASRSVRALKNFW